MSSAPISDFTYKGRPLPTPAPSLEDADASDALLLTARLVQQLLDFKAPKVRKLLQERKEVQRLVQLKDLPGGKGSATYDLVGNTHALGVACYLFMQSSAITIVDYQECSICASPNSVGPMAQCVAEDPAQGNWISGACTNCYYKGRGLQCSFRQAPAAAPRAGPTSHQTASKAGQPVHKAAFGAGPIVNVAACRADPLAHEAASRAGREDHLEFDDGLSSEEGLGLEDELDLEREFNLEEELDLEDQVETHSEHAEGTVSWVVAQAIEQHRKEALSVHGVFGKHGPFSKERRGKLVDRQDIDMDSDEDDLPPLVPEAMDLDDATAIQHANSANDFPEVPRYKIRWVFKEMHKSGKEEKFAEGVPLDRLRQILTEIQGDEDDQIFPEGSYFERILHGSHSQEEGQGGEDIDMDGPGMQDDLPPPLLDPDDSAAGDAAMQVEEPPTHQLDWTFDIDMHRLAALAEPSGSTRQLADGDNGIDTGASFITKRPAQTDLRKNVSAKKHKRDS